MARIVLGILIWVITAYSIPLFSFKNFRISETGISISPVDRDNITEESNNANNTKIENPHFLFLLCSRVLNLFSIRNQLIIV
jgi:hypothetical protein